MRKFSVFFIFVVCIICLPKKSPAAEPMEAMQANILELQKSVKTLQTTVENQNEVLRQQAVKIDALERVKGSAMPQAAGAASTTPAGAPKLAGLSQAETQWFRHARRPLTGLSSQGFNPDIGVVGTVMGNITENPDDGEGRNTVALKELELNFAQVVDPYSRLDAILSFNDNLEAQNANIEEAYYSHWGLPLGFRAQIGKFRAKIGKQNLQHLHALDTSDYPLVIRDFFGDEGLASSGVRLVHEIPNPWDIPLEISGELLRGNEGNSFSGVSRRPIFDTHLKTFFETSPDSNLELGATAMFGDSNRDIVELDGQGVAFNNHPENGRSRYDVHVFGADATWNWFLSEGRVIKFQNEAYVQQRDNTRHPNNDPWGFYSLVDYRFSPRFSVGLRWDYLQPLDVVDEHRQTTAFSPYITFWQSEFANFRLQYTHTDPADSASRSNDELFLQANFLIGAHKHPVQ